MLQEEAAKSYTDAPTKKGKKKKKQKEVSVKEEKAKEPPAADEETKKEEETEKEEETKKETSDSASPGISWKDEPHRSSEHRTHCPVDFANADVFELDDD